MQIENLQTQPSVAIKLQRGELNLHAWIYLIESGDILAYSTKDGGFASLTDERAAGETVIHRQETLGHLRQSTG
jgi:carbonic anhydrase